MFQRIIERGIKLDRLDILLTAGTGFFQNQCHLSRQDPDRVLPCHTMKSSAKLPLAY